MAFGRNSQKQGAGFDITRSLDSRTRIVNGKIFVPNDGAKSPRRRRFFGSGQSNPPPLSPSSSRRTVSERVARAVSSSIPYRRSQSVETPRTADDSDETDSMAHAATIMKKYESRPPSDIALVKASPGSLPDQSANQRKYRYWDDKPTANASATLADRLLSSGPRDPDHDFDIRHTIATDIPLSVPRERPPTAWQASRSDSTSTLGFDQSVCSASQPGDRKPSSSELQFNVHPGPPENAGLVVDPKKNSSIRRNSLTGVVGELARATKREVTDKAKRFRSTERRSHSVGAEMKKGFAGYGEKGATYKPKGAASKGKPNEASSRGTGRLTTALLGDSSSNSTTSTGKPKISYIEPRGRHDTRSASTGHMSRHTNVNDAYYSSIATKGLGGLTDDEDATFRPTPKMKLEMV